ncbi:MAG: hypothetical protein B1H11_07250 [Desulfobacteraceae bacterium 4484_190.1]|nr:MAG: hypothetical protein B1H11_07250 [Desulfobacteraceae bacterium 4484_190.1]
MSGAWEPRKADMRSPAGTGERVKQVQSVMLFWWATTGACPEIIDLYPVYVFLSIFLLVSIQ